MDKVPFSEAARLAGIHPNTIRNWRKAGKLKTCEKVFENGIEVWIVDPDEISKVGLQKVAPGDNNNNNSVNTPDVKPDFTLAPPGPAFEQSLVFMRESVVKPLTDLIERQSNQIKDMSEEIGTLKERVKQLEAAQSSRDAARLAESPPPINISPRAGNGPQEPSPILHSDTLQPVTTPTKKGFWARLLGG